MTKYKLTTDLIADCMALIPENLEELNKQDIFDIEVNDSEEQEIYYVYGLYIGEYVELPDEIRFLIISHCLRTIPEFQVKNQGHQELIDKFNEPVSYKTAFEVIQLLSKQPKTIAAATLHGQGEYPPSTLEELCESYKNVMMK